MTRSLEANRWDDEYLKGRYEDEPPITFVDRIIAELGKEAETQIGLYVGCGNGRNYIPMLQQGLRIRGMDVSEVAIEQLKSKYPEAEGTDKVSTGDPRRHGFTVCCDEGPKEGMEIHFFTQRELKDLSIKNSFDVIQPAYEVTEARKEPETGIWSQWERIWQKR